MDRPHVAEYRAENLTRTERDVLLTLRTFRGNGGAIHPSHDTLAGRVKCHVSSIQRALRQARELGLVTWIERRVRAGWRWLSTSNAYRLAVPDTPVEAGQKPVWRRVSTTGQKPGVSPLGSVTNLSSGAYAEIGGSEFEPRSRSEVVIVLSAER